ncbi:hypothetical protein Avbf_01328 [Armadillidium vulgare]|nr:hypothetical protein Avbf_01328 [Armadillidium vulgare]
MNVLLVETSFNNELSMNDHCNNGLCLRSKDGESSHEKENYFITKLHHEMHKTRVLNDFIVKVIPVYLNHEPLGTEMVSPNDAHLIKNIEKKNLFEFHTEKLKKKLNEFKPQLFENESVKKSEVLLQEKSNIGNFCNKSENLSFEHLSIISSESLVGLLQNKTINIDGTPFISYSELMCIKVIQTTRMLMRISMKSVKSRSCSTWERCLIAFERFFERRDSASSRQYSSITFAYAKTF